MAMMTEGCSVCGTTFEVQFRYQMEERGGGFMFFCSQACHTRALKGEADGGVVCDACSKRFQLDLVSQVVRVRGERRYACSEECRKEVAGEVGGARLGASLAPSRAPLNRLPEPENRGAEPEDEEAPTFARGEPTSATFAVTPVRRPKQTQKIAIFNHKGGTGKTTTSVSIAAGFALRGLRVLLVDTDSQGNVGVSLAVKSEKSLYHVLVMGLRPQDAAVKVRDNLDLLVANETLAAAELYLAGRQNRDRILVERLAPAFDHYDVVMLDCSPSLSLMNQNALVVADGVVVPVACDYLSLVGVRQVIKTVKNVNALLRHPVQIAGVLPTFYDARARICRDALDTLKEHFGPKTLSPIRSATRFKEAPAQGKTIFEYAPDSNAAEDYWRVVGDLITGFEAEKPMASVPRAQGAI